MSKNMEHNAQVAVAYLESDLTKFPNSVPIKLTIKLSNSMGL